MKSQRSRTQTQESDSGTKSGRPFHFLALFPADAKWQSLLAASICQRPSEMWESTAVWPRFSRLAPPRWWLTPSSANHHPLGSIIYLNSSSLAAGDSSVQMLRAAAAVTGNFVSSSGFTVCVCKVSMQVGGWHQVKRVMCCIHPNREGEGGERPGLTVRRTRVCWSGTVARNTHTRRHTLSSHTVHRLVFVKGRRSSFTVTHVLRLGVRRWMYGGCSQMFPLQCQHCDEQQKRHPAWQDESCSRKEE